MILTSGINRDAHSLRYWPPTQRSYYSPNPPRKITLNTTRMQKTWYVFPLLSLWLGLINDTAFSRLLILWGAGHSLHGMIRREKWQWDVMFIRASRVFWYYHMHHHCLKLIYKAEQYSPDSWSSIAGKEEANDTTFFGDRMYLHTCEEVMRFHFDLFFLPGICIWFIGMFTWSSYFYGRVEPLSISVCMFSHVGYFDHWECLCEF